MANLKRLLPSGTDMLNVDLLAVASAKQIDNCDDVGYRDLTDVFSDFNVEGVENWTDYTALARTIEGEIIPRMLLAHRAAAVSDEPRPASGRHITERDVRQLVECTLSREERAANDFVRGVRDEGATVEQIFIDLLSPAARILGELWEEDERDFTEVTIGLWRLQSTLRDLGAGFTGDSEHHYGSGRAALITPVTGEQHTFGVAMVSDFFRRAGWSVVDGTNGSTAELCDIVKSQSFDIIGLSCSGSNGVDTIGTLIRKLRHASLNKGVGIMVGGNIFSNDAELAGRVGADATARDAVHAPLQAENLLQLMSSRHHQT